MYKIGRPKVRWTTKTEARQWLIPGKTKSCIGKAMKSQNTTGVNCAWYLHSHTTKKCSVTIPERWGEGREKCMVCMFCGSYVKKVRSSSFKILSQHIKEKNCKNQHTQQISVLHTEMRT